MKTLPRHVPYLDGWRGIAIIAVLFSHFIHYPDYWWVGRVGVQLFLVLSGYLMCNILFIKQTALPDFFARRAIRILPTFFLYVLTVFLVFVALRPKSYEPSLANLIATLTFTRTYLPYPSDIFKDALPIGHVWSLNVEEHSYMFLALVAFLTRPLRNRWVTATVLIAATAVAFLCSYWYFNHPPVQGSPGDVRTESASLALLASVCIAYIKFHFPSKMYSKVPSLLPAIAVGAAFLCFWQPHISSERTLAPLLMAFAINFIDRSPAFLIQALSLRVLRWFGICSFSLYLWQQPFMMIGHHGASDILVLVLAVCVGALSYYLFENPVRIKLTAAWNRRSLLMHTEQNSLHATPE